MGDSMPGACSFFEPERSLSGHTGSKKMRPGERPTVGGMRYGLSIPPFTDPATVVAMATDAEAAGWDGVFLWDHMQWDTSLRLDIHDPWVLLGAAAARTERVRLGTLVTPLARRRPWVVAKHLTTLDHLSNGRAVLGVGLGVPADSDFGAFGDPDEPKVQAELLDDGLDLIDALLRGGPVDHHGPRFEVQAELLPAPVQQPRPPIWVAATAPYRRSLSRAARWDGIAPLGTSAILSPAELAAYVEPVEQPPDWDIVAFAAPDVPFDEYAAVGATWVIESEWPTGDWVTDLRARIRRGPA
jgi:alkanesulfonate monooxygenase SsuD/methylene tetrahydromethanopterin reductase-like flavin-dependent oxidoreductase (luciferase family)